MAVDSALLAAIRASPVDGGVGGLSACSVVWRSSAASAVSSVSCCLRRVGVLDMDAALRRMSCSSSALRVGLRALGRAVYAGVGRCSGAICRSAVCCRPVLATMPANMFLKVAVDVCSAARD